MSKATFGLDIPEFADDEIGRMYRDMHKSLAKSLDRALKRELAKADLPDRFDSATVTSTSNDVMQSPLKFSATRKREPEAVSADNAPSIAVLTVDSVSYNVVEFGFSLDGQGDLARALGTDAYISAAVQTEAGDSLVAALGSRRCNVVLRTGEATIRGFSMAGSVINARQPGRLSLIFLGNAGSVKAV